MYLSEGEERARTRSLGQILSMRSCSICWITERLVSDLQTVSRGRGDASRADSTYLALLVPDSPVEVLALHAQEVVTRLDDAALAGDGARRVDVVAGNHAHGDPSALAHLDGIRDLEEEEEEEEDEEERIVISCHGEIRL